MHFERNVARILLRQQRILQTRCVADGTVDFISCANQLVRTRDEIDSSIRYAARLQNALLPKQYPGDISFKVHWRPRDLVGGDIYFVHSLPDRVYIAVVDCTGHGVPGAPGTP